MSESLHVGIAELIRATHTIVPDCSRITGNPDITRQGGGNVRVADEPEITE